MGRRPAAFAFAVDDAHALPAMWIANRNATIGTCLALPAHVAHDRWRREGWRPGVVLAPLALLLGLLGAEMASRPAPIRSPTPCSSDEAPQPARLASLLPSGPAGLGWAFAYGGWGFGASGSAMYIDPLASPLDFLHAVIARGPLLLFGQWTLPAQLSLLPCRGLTHRASVALESTPRPVVPAERRLVRGPRSQEHPRQR